MDDQCQRGSYESARFVKYVSVAVAIDEWLSQAVSARPEEFSETSYRQQIDVLDGTISDVVNQLA